VCSAWFDTINFRFVYLINGVEDLMFHIPATNVLFFPLHLMCLNLWHHKCFQCNMKHNNTYAQIQGSSISIETRLQAG